MGVLVLSQLEPIKGGEYQPNFLRYSLISDFLCSPSFLTFFALVTTTLFMLQAIKQTNPEQRSSQHRTLYLPLHTLCLISNIFKNYECIEITKYVDCCLIALLFWAYFAPISHSQKMKVLMTVLAVVFIGKKGIIVLICFAWILRPLQEK